MRRRILREILAELGLPENAAPASFDVIGDILVLRPPHGWGEIPSYYKHIAEKLLEKLPYIKTVVVTITPVTGVYRTRRLVHLAGERKTRTIYREHGCIFLVDIENAYISPRLSYEHMRIAKQTRPGEVIVNMFAGVGGFSIIIGKHGKAEKIYSIDINPVAVELLRENVRLNRLEEKVIPIEGDARNVIRRMLKGCAHRVLMPLPSMDPSFYKAAVEALSSNKGIIHAYEFVTTKNNPVSTAYKAVRNILENLGYECKLLEGRIVRSVGPRKYQVVLDLEIT